MNPSVPPVAHPTMIPAKDPGRRFGVAFDVEPWRGCPFGCLYCDSIDAIGVDEALSDVSSRADLVATFSSEIGHREPGTIVGLGRLFEPYPPLEEKERVTRRILEAIRDAGAGVVIVTKSPLVTDDADILKEIAKRAPAVVVLSITTMNEDVARKLEAGCPTTAERFRALSRLAQEGILTGVLMQPIVPFVNDTEENVVQIVRKAKDAGCKFAYPTFGMNLAGRGRDRFLDLIDREFPRLRNVYMDHFGERRSCQSKAAPALKKAFVFECRKLRLKYGMNDIVRLIRPASNVQLKLF
ncbi:MAG: radical SAM protein [Candidatus Izemoplasmatales bacterium]